jgi:hypothetical protein
MIIKISYKEEMRPKVTQMRTEVLFRVKVEFVSIFSKLVGSEMFA